MDHSTQPAVAASVTSAAFDAIRSNWTRAPASATARAEVAPTKEEEAAARATALRVVIENKTAAAGAAVPLNYVVSSLIVKWEEEEEGQE